MAYYPHASAAYQSHNYVVQSAFNTININEWNGGLFSCFDDFETCLKSFICAPVFLAMEKSEWDGTNCCFNLFCMNPFDTRHQVRTVYGIGGNCIYDIMAVICCPFCAYAQVMRTMRSHGPIGRRIS